YIDHRASSRSVISALAPLGERAVIDHLAPPSLERFRAVLGEAARSGEPYDIVHFDGHGEADPAHGGAALLFEDHADAHRTYRRRSRLVGAEELGRSLPDQGVRLVILDACRTAAIDSRGAISMAQQLMEWGAGSVVAMSHRSMVDRT